MNNMNDNEMNTSGLNADTFRVPGTAANSVDEGWKTSANSWTGGSAYSVTGYTGMEPESITGESKGLEIATLVFGILAIVICCCNGLFGLVGVILGIIAFAKGKRSGIAIAGFVCSVLGLLAALGILVFSATDYGQELQKAFWEGFEQGYESTSGEDINISDSDDFDNSGEIDVSTDSTVQEHEGTASVSDEVAGKIVVDGAEIRIPCKLSDVLEVYEVSESSEADMEGGLSSYQSKLIYLTKNGEESGIFVSVENYTEQDLKDVKDGNIGIISIDNEPEKDVEMLGGVKLGMSESQLEEFLDDMEYTKSEMDGVSFYSLYTGDDSNYCFSITVSEGEVITVALYYLEF